MKIYVVMGSTGEYSDRCEWPVVAYQDEAMAQAHVLAAGTEARRIELELQALDGDWGPDTYRKREEALKSSPFDPSLYMSYNGTHYFIYAVEVATAIPVSLPAAPVAE